MRVFPNLQSNLTIDRKEIFFFDLKDIKKNAHIYKSIKKKSLRHN